MDLYEIFKRADLQQRHNLMGHPNISIGDKLTTLYDMFVNDIDLAKEFIDVLRDDDKRRIANELTRQYHEFGNDADECGYACQEIADKMNIMGDKEDYKDYCYTLKICLENRRYAYNARLLVSFILGDSDWGHDEALIRASEQITRCENLYDAYQCDN